MAAPTIELNNGQKIPQLGLGTWLAVEGECAEAVYNAIVAGYRHIDCAWLYGNEKEVGQGARRAISEGLVKREDLFICTKLWNTFHEKDQVIPACKTSNENLGLTYIDLYLMHWPVACKSTGHFDINLPFKDAVYYEHDFVETWKGLEECVKVGLAKSIGLSNFNSKQVERILAACEIKPVVNQIEVSPNLNQKKLISFCKARSIEIQAYSPFGSPARPWKTPGDPDLHLDDPKIVAIGNKYGKTGGQVVLRYLVQLGVIPIPKSSNKNRIKQNIDIFDFQLTNDEMEILDSFDCNGRAVHAEELMESSEYPFRGVEF